MAPYQCCVPPIRRMSWCAQFSFLQISFITQERYCDAHGDNSGVHRMSIRSFTCCSPCQTYERPHASNLTNFFGYRIIKLGQPPAWNGAVLQHVPGIEVAFPRHRPGLAIGFVVLLLFPFLSNDDGAAVDKDCRDGEEKDPSHDWYWGGATFRSDQSTHYGPIV